MRRLLAPLRRHTLNDHEEMVRFIKIFLEHVPQYMQLLRSAFDNKNTKAMEAELHKLKSTFRVMGLTKAEKLSRTVERQLQTNSDFHEIILIHQALEKEVEELIPAYEIQIVKLGGGREAV